MIVDPDFFEHWRTRMLIDALGGDQMAPMYVLRIWAHCQQRRSMEFTMSCNGLKALCRFTGNGQDLESSLIDAGFIDRNGGAIMVPKWGEHNAKLISNWKNGANGGRPKASDGNPKDTEEEPKENPNKTQNEPTGTHAEPIGGEERRGDLKPTTTSDEVVVVANYAGNAPASVDVKPDCPHQQIIALYHEILPMCPQVRDWTSARAQQLRSRWNEDKSRQNLDYWRRFFEYVKTCGFLVGNQPNPQRRPFFADLEWLTKSSNFTKIRERKYE